MIPLGDVTPRRTRPLVTLVLATLLSAALVVTHAVIGPAVRLAWLYSWGSRPDTLPLPALLTAVWLEPAWFGGVANVLILVLLGPAVEDRLGHGRLAVLFALAAVVSLGLAGPATSSVAPSAGAAGAAGAVGAAHLRLFPTSKLAWWLPAPKGGRLVEMPAFWALGAWALAVMSPHAAVPGAGLALGALLGRRLARADRLAVAWWDRTP